MIVDRFLQFIASFGNMSLSLMEAEKIVLEDVFGASAVFDMTLSY